MKKTFAKGLSIALAAVLAAGGATGALYIHSAANKDNTTVYAAEAGSGAATEEAKTGSFDISTLLPESASGKNETVYVLAGTDGTVNKVIVSDWIKNPEGAAVINDKSNLTDIEVVKGDSTYTLGSDNSVVWNAGEKDVYYRGSAAGELPVKVKVSCTLDGQAVEAKDMLGKSGHVTIRFDYENTCYRTVTINGKEEQMCVPFVMVTGVALDDEVFTNVKVTNGRLVNDGARTAVIGVAVPGMNENLGIDAETFEFPTYVEISADVTDFRLGMSMTVAANNLFKADLGSGNAEAAEEDIKNAVNELKDAMDQLMSGSGELYDGLCTLLSKTDELAEGVKKLADGATELKNGAAALSNGAGEVAKGSADLANGLKTIIANNETLNGGAKQVFESLLATAEEQLKAAGIEVPHMTIENYAAVLDGVVASLDKDAVYEKAVKTVTEAVEANRSLVEAKVTEAVKAQVEAQVKAAVIAQFGEAAAESEQVQAIIAAKTEEQMASDAVKQLIAQNTDAQVEQLIAQNLESDEVKAKLEAAQAGAVRVAALKASLDSYNRFYQGLAAYTDGVSTAAAGAEKLAGGANELKAGAEKLAAGAEKLDAGAAELNSNMPALKDGVQQLCDGSLALRDGLSEFNEKGISRITELVEGNLENVIERYEAMRDLAAGYNTFSGIADGTDGEVKFIIRTEGVEAE